MTSDHRYSLAGPPEPEVRHGQAAYNTAHLVLNVVPIEVPPDASVEVSVHTRSSSVRELRRRLRGEQFVWGAGDEIWTVPLNGHDHRKGKSTRIVKVHEAPHLLCGLMNERLIEVLVGDGWGEIDDHRPVVLISGRPQDELLHVALRPQVAPSGLTMRVTIPLEVRYYERDDGSVWWGLTVDVDTTVQIDIPCSELLKQGVSIVNRRVKKDIGGSDDRLRALRRTVGTVSKIDKSKGRLHLTDTTGEDESVAASDTYLVPNLSNLEACLRALVNGGHRRARELCQRLREMAGMVRSGESRHELVAGIVDALRGRDWTLAPGLQVALGHPLDSKVSTFPEHTVFAPAQLLFHPRESDKRASLPWKGLDLYGPHDEGVNSNKILRIAIICHRRNIPKAREFKKQFVDGVDGHDAFSQGFLDRFRVKKQPEVFCFPMEASRTSDYREACVKVAAHAARQGFRWDLVLVQTEEMFKARRNADNPYLVTKALLLPECEAVQAFTQRTMNQQPYALGYSLNNMSLQVYAKMGGIPWGLEVEGRSAHEIVIGMRSHSVFSNGPRGAERFMGLATVFSSDGQYLLEGRSRVVGFAEYGDELLKTVEEAVTHVRADRGWAHDDPVRLIFHIPKRLKHIEIDAVERLMKRLNFTNATFAFLTISQHHHFALVDTLQRGVSLKRGGRKGVYGPSVGEFVRLDKFEALLSVKGPRDVKRATDGLARPLKLRLHPHSTMTDLPYLARQILALSRHSWRTFDRVPEPITMTYPKRIAKLLVALDDVPEWDVVKAVGQISRRRWFL